MASPRFCGGKVSSRIDCDSGCSAPPPAPCTARAIRIQARLVDAPQANDEIVKIDDAGDEKSLSPEAQRKPRTGWQNNRVGHEIAGEHPRSFVVGRRQTAGDVRQRDGGDGSVQHFHERRQHDRNRDQPGIASAERTLLPGGVIVCQVPKDARLRFQVCRSFVTKRSVLESMLQRSRRRSWGFRCRGMPLKRRTEDRYQRSLSTARRLPYLTRQKMPVGRSRMVETPGRQQCCADVRASAISDLLPLLGCPLTVRCFFERDAVAIFRELRHSIPPRLASPPPPHIL